MNEDEMPRTLPQLSTDRLLLRPISLNDVDAMQNYRGREDVTRHLLHEPLSLAETRTRITRSLERWAEYPAAPLNLSFGIEVMPHASPDGAGEARSAHGEHDLDDPADIIGDLHVWNVVPDASSTATTDHTFWLGYALHPAAQGNGYAREAAARAVRWVFEELGATEVRAIARAANAPSIKLLRNAGFALVDTPARIGKVEPDEVELRLLAADWASQQSAESDSPTAAPGIPAAFNTTRI